MLSSRPILTGVLLVVLAATSGCQVSEATPDRDHTVRVTVDTSQAAEGASGAATPTIEVRESFTALPPGTSEATLSPAREPYEIPVGDAVRGYWSAFPIYADLSDGLNGTQTLKLLLVMENKTQEVQIAHLETTGSAVPIPRVFDERGTDYPCQASSVMLAPGFRGYLPPGFSERLYVRCTITDQPAELTASFSDYVSDYPDLELPTQPGSATTDTRVRFSTGQHWPDLIPSYPGLGGTTELPGVATVTLADIEPQTSQTEGFVWNLTLEVVNHQTTDLALPDAALFEVIGGSSLALFFPSPSSADTSVDPVIGPGLTGTWQVRVPAADYQHCLLVIYFPPAADPTQSGPNYAVFRLQDGLRGALEPLDPDRSR